MNVQKAQAERILARNLHTDDETTALTELRLATAEEVTRLCGPALTLRLALLVMITARLDVAEMDRVGKSITAERFGSTGGRL